MTEQKQRRKPRKYTDEFKKQLVDLYHSGKRRCDICREYDIATSLFDKWVKQEENSGSFHEKDNRTPEQEELIRLRKENRLQLWNTKNKESVRKTGETSIPSSHRKNHKTERNGIELHDNTV